MREWKLVYSPINPIFEEIADLAAKSLQLEGVVAANSSEELESIMFNQELVAGIDFQHPPVKFQIEIVAFAQFFNGINFLFRRTQLKYQRI